MRLKNGRDFIELGDCVISVDDDGKVFLRTMSESIEITAKEWVKLQRFVLMRHNAKLPGAEHPHQALS